MGACPAMAHCRERTQTSRHRRSKRCARRPSPDERPEKRSDDTGATTTWSSGVALRRRVPGRRATLVHLARGLPSSLSPHTFSLTWWLWRGGCTRSHSELGRETPQRRWYSVSRRGRVGRRQVCKKVSGKFETVSSLHRYAITPALHPHGGRWCAWGARSLGSSRSKRGNNRGSGQRTLLQLQQCLSL